MSRNGRPERSQPAIGISRNPPLRWHQRRGGSSWPSACCCSRNWPWDLSGFETGVAVMSHMVAWRTPGTTHEETGSAAFATPANSCCCAAAVLMSVGLLGILARRQHADPPGAALIYGRQPPEAGNLMSPVDEFGKELDMPKDRVKGSCRERPGAGLYRAQRADTRRRQNRPVRSGKSFGTVYDMSAPSSSSGSPGPARWPAC